MKTAILTRSLEAGNACGDIGKCWSRGPLKILALADGLGHGLLAAEAAAAAMDTLEHDWHGHLAEAFSLCSDGVAQTRGAALAITVIDEAAGKLTFAGVGNIRGALLADKIVWFSCNPGIVGSGIPRITIQEATFECAMMLVLWTDGLHSRVRFDGVPPLSRRDPEAFCGWMLEEFGTRSDDAGIICALMGGGDA